MINLWTDKERDEVLRLIALGMTQRDIGLRVGRTLFAIKAAMRAIRMTPADREKERIRENNRKDRFRSPRPKCCQADYVSTLSRPSAEMEEERDRRCYQAPVRDPSCAQLGDPPVGYSALERRG